MRSKLKTFPIFYLVFAVLLLAACHTSIAAENSSSIPLDQAWDISTPNSLLQRDIRINKYAVYELAIGFAVINKDEYIQHKKEQYKQIKDFVGEAPDILYDKNAQKFIPFDSSDAEYTCIANGSLVWKSSRPGVVVPVHYKIEKYTQNGHLLPVTEERLDTGGVGGVIPHGGQSRHIAFIKLKPGKYKITLNTNKKVLLPQNVKTYIELYKRPNSLPLNSDE